ncbi:alkylhydroperoxidase AhpD family core domain-containing protein [Polaribacter sp. KT25b]|uniref:carboxymuconolactone decarboxylase family protein n=1 Tax=Polaribacter sp. KT25b TaxID=1855336 RepID=UPI00087A15F1|nr:carboxymuconolactone decarboxylase family protein [Polaribacter sp. KT25b]SDS24237.1 alkylhydroperoxidase AhpD family core domain-containing protein [Polaribacter sp. KT25b]
MKTDTQKPKAIKLQTEFKNKFSLGELYSASVYLPRAIIKMMENSKNKLIDNDFVKRLQLAVTEVNGCVICSYGHTKMALRQGMSGEEISSFLSGENHFIKPEEAKAIMFAQYYADTRGYPKKYAFDSIVKEYGNKNANIILSVIQIMTVGNIFGIPFSAFQARLKGKPYKDSSLFFELGTLIIGVFLLPIAIIHGLLRSLIGLPNSRFDKSSSE